MVVKVIIANKIIHRVLIDNDSSTDIIFALTFDKMGIGRDKLELFKTHLLKFWRERVLPLGSVQLILTMRDPPCQSTTIVRFLMVDVLAAYDAILGRPSLNTIRAIPYAYNLVMKVPTKNGVGMVRVGQHVARECYVASMKQKEVETI